MADALVVQTDALLPWAQSIIGKERAHVVPNPVRDMGHVIQLPTVERGAVIVAAGRLVSAKGFDILLEAFAAATRDMPQWNLIILGDGPERDRLTELARHLRIIDRVSLAGWVAEPGEVMLGASVFVLSSRYEGFPNALLEAMACGLPVIASACLGPAQIISDQVDGLLVQVGSASELSAAVLRLITDEKLRNKLGRNARAVSTRYKLESIIPLWDRLLGVESLTASPVLRQTPASLR
jgi:glycosyltransferase involved in cell wall biosynthesis